MQKFTFIRTLALALTLAACGQSPAQQAHTADAATNSDRYNCVTQYSDKSLQERPMWDERFEADLSNPEGTVKNFGVSPGNGGYIAFVGVNKPDGLALTILNKDSGLSSIAVYEKGTRTGFVILRTSPTQTLSLVCQLP